jgi:hypothetical protein
VARPSYAGSARTTDALPAAKEIVADRAGTRQAIKPLLGDAIAVDARLKT